MADDEEDGDEATTTDDYMVMHGDDWRSVHAVGHKVKSTNSVLITNYYRIMRK